MRVGNKETKPRVTRKYKTADELQAAIDAYFANPDTKVILTKGERVEVEVMTLEHIAINHLGFKTKQSLYDYRNRYPNEGYGEVLDNLTDQALSWWITRGSEVQTPTCSIMIERLSRRRENIRLTKEMSSIEQAQKLIESAASDDISLDTMQKLLNAVKTKSDINKVDELERLVRELADMAGIK